MLKNKYLIFLIPLLTLMLSACGASIVKSPLLESNSSPYLVFIPTKAPEGISRERAEYIAELVRLNLESKGYVLLSSDIVSNFCKDSECSNRDELLQKFKLTKFAQMGLESSSSIDFLAGYYSSITGAFNIDDEKGTSLYMAAHTQRDSGGLILESGQVIQAIINQARNGDESSIDKVSYRFVSNLLKEVPRAKEGADNRLGQMLLLSKVSSEKFLGGSQKICAYGTPEQAAWLISKEGASAELKEIKTGEYCAAFRLEGPWAVSENLKVELRSSFGELVRLEVGK